MYLGKDKQDILRLALQKLQEKTVVTSIGPGSVARSIAEIVINEIGDLYSILDFNTSMGVLSTAQGRSLDLIAQLYNVQRKQIGSVATLDQSIGVFYFYLDSPHGSDIIIPQGTTVFTTQNDFIGDQFTYTTSSAATIPAGRTRVYVGIQPTFADSVFTAGANTITGHNATAPNGVTLKCTNPKPVAAQIGYETDENFRARIVKSVRTSAGGTLESVRFAGLSVDGVRDIKIRQTPYGLGSFEALLVPENRSTLPQLIVRVSNEMDAVRPVGVRMFIREPDYTSVEIAATIVIRKDANVDSAGTARRAEIATLRYINTMLPGTTLIYNQLIQAIMDSSDAIFDVAVTRFQIGGVEVLRKNYTAKEDQQIVPGNITMLAS